MIKKIISEEVFIIKIENCSAKSAVLLNLETNEILFEKNIDQRLPMASLTKIMTAILIFEKISEKSMKLTDRVTIDDHAAYIRGSRIKLEFGDQITVHDLLKGLMISSGNDAAVALAGFAEKSVKRFINKMNQKATQIGLRSTSFSNPHGLPAKQHYSIARELAILSQKLLEEEEILRITSLASTEIVVNQEKRTIKNTNPLIGVYEGADGLKTGHTPQAGFCLVATAKRHDTRLLAIVLGEPSRRARNNDINQMLEYGFSLII